MQRKCAKRKKRRLLKVYAFFWFKLPFPGNQTQSKNAMLWFQRLPISLKG